MPRSLSAQDDLSETLHSSKQITGAGETPTAASRLVNNRA